MSSEKKVIFFSIRVKLSLLLFSFALCPLFINNWMSFLAAEKALEKSTLSGLNLSAEYKAGEIYLYLETLKTNTRDFATDGFIKRSLGQTALYNSDTTALNQHLVYNKLPSHSDLISIDIMDTQGVIVASTQTQRIGLALRDLLTFQRGSEGVYVSAVKRSPAGKLTGSIAIPLYKTSDSSAIIGVLVNHYRMDKLQDLFSGKLIAALGGKPQYRNLSVQEAVYLVDFSGQFLTHSAEFINQRAVINTYPVQQAKIFNLETDGIWDNGLGTAVIGVSSIVEIDDFKYLLIVEKQLDAAFENIQQLKSRSYLLFLITLLAASLVSWLMAYYITLPMQQLMSCIDHVSTGKFESSLRDIKHRDEFGLLASKFNHMTQKIKRMHHQLTEKNRELYHQSILDSLTGLYNHRHLLERGAYCIATAKRHNKTLSCLMIDIDHFKGINDKYGHPFGDFVLSSIAKVFKSQLRKSDILSRYGGEEFAIIMPDTDGENALLAVEQIRHGIKSHLFMQGATQHWLTISIGVAEYNHLDNDLMDIISRADSALYQSKHEGRDRSTLATDTRHIAWHTG